MVLVRYRSTCVFSLGGWTPHLPAGLACPAVLFKQLIDRSPTGLSPSTASLSRLFGSVFGAAGCSTFARHYSRNRFFSSGYLDVSLHPVPSTHPMCSGESTSPCRDVGFPIRTSPVHAGAHPSPELFAVYRVLLRHSSPSHSPCALVASLLFNMCLPETLFLSSVRRVPRSTALLTPPLAGQIKSAPQPLTHSVRVTLVFLHYSLGKVLPGSSPGHNGYAAPRRLSALTA